MSAGRQGTWNAARRVLAVVRNPTSLDRLLSLVDVLELDLLEPDGFTEIRFTVDAGSAFDRGLVDHLERLGGAVLPWEEACRTPWDLVLAAHVTPELGRLPGPVVVVPHGAGYRRLQPGGTAPAGLTRDQLVRGGRLIPSVIGLSHQEQLRTLLANVPEARDHAVVIGDPVVDQLRASGDLRHRYRRRLGVEPHQRLVVISSTWGEHSTLGVAPDLPHRLLSQLPADTHRVALVRHWNVEQAHSSFEVDLVLRRAREGGLITVPPDRGWQAALVAADLVIGDHGSVTLYGAALDKPVLLVSDGGPEVEQGSADARLWAAVERVAAGDDLRGRVERAHRRPLGEFTDRVLGAPGQSARLLNDVVRGVLELPPAPPPRLRPLPEPTRFETPAVGSHWCAAKVAPGGGGVELERFPVVAGCPPPVAAQDPFLVVDVQWEVDEVRRSNAEVIVDSEPRPAEQEARTWLLDALDRYPGAAVAAARLDSGCLLALRDRTVVGLDGDDPAIAAAAFHAWSIAGHPGDVPRFEVVLGTAAVEFTARRRRPVSVFPRF
ncbi:hypothetical protein [Saccharothrix lopnurensis]|uniref:CDP-glycerol:poly(Glycerophosphate) glycerophosphotransferase n=1 Tax=Saccharothrix lopnurensis TaxID=1670621 RepID=A0ABW1P3X8_9PSEU